MTTESHPRDREVGEFRFEDEELLDLPPSAKFVYVMLYYHGPVTHGELVDITGMPTRTVRYALERLRETTDQVKKRPNPNDARQDLYSLDTQGSCQDC